MSIIKAPYLLQILYPGLIWHKHRKEKSLFLTFDDGPIPDVTEEVLFILEKYGIEATFFCVGENIVKNPTIFEKLKQGNHRIGNHSYNHLNGWKTENEVYFENIEKCERLVNSRLFRPPYSKIKRSQIAELKKDYEIVMWDVISRDYDPRVSPADCLKNVLKHSENGSIIVFHDHVKAAPNMLYALPRAIEEWLKAGFSFKKL